ncbi:serine acetyltransferase [Sedimentitalea sp. CY04]|uniref:serine O-acetyltransferase n=1 Tax=Parasedimentitalea denitrificans TaxID=2211118 RepID=A0ABX0W8A8_9RHOB|nr:serine O-acetyltransferase EpsC [Sedimentitalea sp. CY04]NIZ61671.1 serine acetyltransferase [Sedimentitalea sp. CY04]
MLVDDVKTLLAADTKAAEILDLSPFEDFAGLAGALFGAICGASIGSLVGQTYDQTPEIVAQTLRDIEETARRNFEPGGVAAVLLFSRGVHATMGHRVAHTLWQNGETSLAMTLKAAFGRAFATDIHPGAQIGAGFWLDHGLGFVAGETAVIGKDVSIWHNVTLGSTFNNPGPDRHPKIEDGAIIGAGALVLGNIKIGAGANIAAGAIVLDDVPAGRVVVGAKAREIGPARVSFLQKEQDT